MDREELAKLAELIRQRAKSAPSAKPKLHIVKTVAAEQKPRLFDSITRDSCLRRIRYLSRAYRLRWLLDQETFHVAALECLEDAELSALLADMERARECMSDDVSFEEAGLVRSRAV